MANIEEALRIINRGTVQVTPEEGMCKKLQSGKRLRVKLGMDPTAPDLHLGHTVVLKKMREFQDLGHEAIFLIGDFTARIGDPTGQSKTRPPLTLDEIAANMKTYFTQAARVIDIDKAKVVFNSEWLGSLNTAELIPICAKITLARLTERNDFAERITDHKPIAMHELLYPILQAFDSVELQADIELGGTDQTFNLMTGRFLQEQYGQDPQVVITMPLLEGLDGTHKMSKSLGNAVAIAEPARDTFGKLMSISDELMWRYFEILLDTPPAEISHMQARVASGNLHPMALKKELAHKIISRFWSLEEANTARQAFEEVHQKKDYSKAAKFTLPAETPCPIWIVELLKILNTVSSSSEAKRLIEAGAVMVDDEVIKDFKASIAWAPGTVVKVGKHHIFRIDE